MVGLGRFELPTSPLSGVRSNQLSYRPELRARTAGAPTPVSGLREKGFEDQVNMLAGYAGRDHRANAEKTEKA